MTNIKGKYIIVGVLLAVSAGLFAWYLINKSHRESSKWIIIE